MISHLYGQEYSSARGACQIDRSVSSASTVYIVKQIFNAGYYWDTIYQDVQDYISNCVTCNQQNVIKQGIILRNRLFLMLAAVFEVISCRFA